MTRFEILDKDEHMCLLNIFQPVCVEPFIIRRNKIKVETRMKNCQLKYVWINVCNARDELLDWESTIQFLLIFIVK